MYEIVHDIQPKTYWLYSQKASALGWRKALAELVDNSLDADAWSVKLSVCRKTLSIVDDGHGCSDIPSMFTLGKHKSQETTKLGIWGIGLKEAAIWFWGRTTISTSDGNIVREAAINWDSLAKRGSWDGALKEAREDATPEACARKGLSGVRGTRIVMENIERSMSPRERESYIESLRLIFHPALKQGRQIIFRHGRSETVLRPIDIPSLEKPIVREEVTLPDGRTFRLFAGIVQDGYEPPFQGFAVSKGHRVIYTTTKGCGDYSVSAFFGWVELCSGWTLLKNKTGIENPEPLHDALFVYCEDILRRAAEFGRAAEFSALCSSAESRLASLVGQSRKQQKGREMRRRKGGGNGRIIPVGTNRKRTNVSRIQSGNRPLRLKPGQKIKIDFVDGTEESLGQAYVEDMRVVLFRNHPAIKNSIEQHNDACLALFAAYLMGISAAADRQFLKGNLPGLADSEVEENALSIVARLLLSFDPSEAKLIVNRSAKDGS